MITIKDFKKRVNKKIPGIFNYEYVSGHYKFSIYKMMFSPIYFEVESRNGNEWRIEQKPIQVDYVEDGIKLANDFLPTPTSKEK